ncbi:M1 family metallopeptidase [Rugamonas sp.]|uniref:M1 family metallopeptidase n=1 Tax=Rugamonas sp. TaxID=1926287 RepID=UPI0025D7DF9F|nr:M1 family metallopeptidase [Rugamonas sp.]
MHIKELATAIAICALTLTNASAATAAKDADRIREVLPDTVIPLDYDLTVSPDADALTFKGRVVITIDVRQATSKIELNAAGLVFDHASVDGGGDAAVKADEKLERTGLAFSAPVKAGKHRLTIDYHGKIGRATLGFFAMDYSTPDGPRRTLATNFEPAAARQFLPCWDEPGRKASFTVAVDAPKDRMALSNMPVAEVTRLSATMQRVRFAKSPRMSTYLLFVGIGDYERVGKQVDGVDVGVVVKRGDLAKADYALQEAVALLHYYNGYFGVSYPLPKLDLIAAPGAIAGGSMENWGAIFYSQNHLLFDPKTSTEPDRRLVFEAVSHEMAHQWFGDLVTMAWWSDLWLNEGFARWMQTAAADDLHPDWQTGLQASAIFEAGKQADSVASTHPVVQQVDTAEQAAQSFDSITYDKGAAFITMMNTYIGRDRFRVGVRRYMRAHAYGNTVDTDLWSIMQRTTGLPVLDIEHDFTRQEGVPLVRVETAAGGVQLRQSRFALDPATIAALPPQLWRLPLQIADEGRQQRGVLLHGGARIASGPAPLVNAGQMAYARVLYDAAGFDALTARLGTLSAVDQLGLINDSLALGIAGDAPLSNPLKLVSALPAASNPIVWQRALAVLSEIDEDYADLAARAKFRRYGLALLTPLSARLGPDAVPGEDANLDILRGRLVQTLSTLGDAGVIADARRRVADGSGTVAQQHSALMIAAAQSDQALFDTLLARAAKSADPQEKQRIYSALAGVTDPDLARRMVGIALGDQAPAGTGASLISRLSRANPDVVWDAFAPKLEDPNLPMPPTTRWDLAIYVASASSSTARIADLQAYQVRNVPVEARKPFLAATAAIRQNQHIARALLPEVDRWISATAP